MRRCLGPWILDENGQPYGSPNEDNVCRLRLRSCTPAYEHIGKGCGYMCRWYAGYALKTRWREMALAVKPGWPRFKRRFWRCFKWFVLRTGEGGCLPDWWLVIRRLYARH